MADLKTLEKAVKDEEAKLATLEKASKDAQAKSAQFGKDLAAMRDASTAANGVALKKNVAFQAAVEKMKPVDEDRKKAETALKNAPEKDKAARQKTYNAVLAFFNERKKEFDKANQERIAAENDAKAKAKAIKDAEATKGQAVKAEWDKAIKAVSDQKAVVDKAKKAVDAAKKK